MGIFNKLFGGADSVRESVTEKYYQHLEIARKNQGDVRDQQLAALYGALATRYMARMKRKTEVELMGEIMSFADIEASSPYSSLDALCDKNQLVINDNANQCKQ